MLITQYIFSLASLMAVTSSATPTKRQTSPPATTSLALDPLLNEPNPDLQLQLCNTDGKIPIYGKPDAQHGYQSPADDVFPQHFREPSYTDDDVLYHQGTAAVLACISKMLDASQYFTGTVTKGEGSDKCLQSFAVALPKDVFTAPFEASNPQKWPPAKVEGFIQYWGFFLHLTSFMHLPFDSSVQSILQAWTGQVADTFNMSSSASTPIRLPGDYKGKADATSYLSICDSWPVIVIVTKDGSVPKGIYSAQAKVGDKVVLRSAETAKEKEYLITEVVAAGDTLSTLQFSEESDGWNVKAPFGKAT